jgi:acetoin utilization deacetylase AcuC-like enzyme
LAAALLALDGRETADVPLSVVWHQDYEVDIGPHVFPTAKYRLVRAQLLDEQLLAPDDLVPPSPATDDDVRLVHTGAYVEKILTGSLSVAEQLMLEVPFSSELREAMWLCAGGSISTARLAIEHTIAVHLGGGFHHAFPDHGEGFCLINDVAIAIRALRRDGALERVLVVDCDVHHGNGTAQAFADDSAVFTMSMHQEANYPAWKPPSDLDLGLSDGTGDVEYLQLLSEHLPRIVREHSPDLTFYLAGADPYAEDQLGGLAMTIRGLRRRDDFVFETLHQANVPIAVVLAGGYARRQDDTVEIHCNTVRAAEALRH